MENSHHENPLIKILDLLITGILVGIGHALESVGNAVQAKDPMLAGLAYIGQMGAWGAAIIGGFIMIEKWLKSKIKEK